MTSKLPGFTKTFGIAALCMMGLAACDGFRSSFNEKIPDEDVDASITLMAITAVQGSIIFDRSTVRSEIETAQAGDGKKYLTSVTYDVFSHQLCHTGLTDGDQTKPVCHEGNDFTSRQNGMLRDVLCAGAEIKQNRAYKQLFCIPAKMT